MIQALLRGGIPLIIMGGIALLLYFQGKYTDAKGTFIASLIAFFVSAATVIYSIDHWSFTKQSVIHFFIMLLTVYPILLLSGWFTISNEVLTPLLAGKRQPIVQFHFRRRVGYRRTCS